MHCEGGDVEAKRRRIELATAPSEEAPDSPPCATVRVSAACLQAREKIQAIDRDYTHYFSVDIGGEAGCDQFVYQHFNNLCVIGIAPSHRALSGGNRIVKVDFDVGRAGDKTDRKPSGKKKAGAKFLIEDSRLCDLICADGTKHRVRCCIRGHLLELNERLISQPELINSKPGTEGYIAILQAKKEDEGSIATAFPSLITEDQYNQLKGRAPTK